MAKLLILKNDPDLVILVRSMLKGVRHEVIGEASVDTIDTLFNPRPDNQNH